jgi:hypothetical protein
MWPSRLMDFMIQLADRRPLRQQFEAIGVAHGIVRTILTSSGCIAEIIDSKRVKLKCGCALLPGLLVFACHRLGPDGVALHLEALEQAIK